MKTLVVFFTLFLLFSCSDSSSDIVGHWQAVDFEYTGDHIYTDSENKEARRNALSHKYTFNDDGTFVHNDFLRIERKGTWKIEGDSLQIVINNRFYKAHDPNDRKTQRFSLYIESLSATEMVLIEKDEYRFRFKKK